MGTVLLIVTVFAVSGFCAWKTLGSGGGSPLRLRRFVFAGACLFPALFLTGLLCVNLVIPGCFAGTLHHYEYADGFVFESINRNDHIAQLTVTEAFFTAPGAALVVSAAGKTVRLPDAAPETLVKCGFGKSIAPNELSLSDGDPGNGGWCIEIRYDGGRLNSVSIRGTKPPVELIVNGAPRKLPRTVGEMRATFGVPASVTETSFL